MLPPSLKCMTITRAIADHVLILYHVMIMECKMPNGCEQLTVLLVHGHMSCWLQRDSARI